MQRAGQAAAHLALALAPHSRRIWVAAGPGNNGGDGLEAAVHLRRAGREVAVSLCGEGRSLPADAARSLLCAQEAGVSFDASPSSMDSHDIALDALLGIGGSRAPLGVIAEAIRRINTLRCPVLAVDVPSGLDVDTGQPRGVDCVRAQHTLTLLTLKPGLFTAAGRDHAGAIWLARLGVDDTAEPPDALLVGTGSIRHRDSARLHAAHKGSYGDVAVVGGAAGMLGAALLAARAAHAAGAGRVYVALVADPDRAPDHDPFRPELMFRPLWWHSPPAVLAATTVVCGCGGGDAVRSALPRLVGIAGRLVLDADALNAISADTGVQASLRLRADRGLPTVLTPHPLEAARLLGATTAEVQADRLGAAQAIADRWGAVVILKGSGSVIAAPGRLAMINATGNAALASAGTGDVLAGWLGGLWAQDTGADTIEGAFDIAVDAVVEHGAASEPASPGPLLAGGLVEALHRRRREPRG